MGVDCIVVEDVEWVWVEDKNDWYILEETQDWHAWDNEGNFWYFGEATLEYLYDDDWIETPDSPSDEGSWTAGEDILEIGSIAEPGIILLADPKPGDCVLQEYYEGEAEDRGKVLRLNATVSSAIEAVEDYEDCLVTKEWTGLEPGNIEHKYYAPDVGLVYIEELKGKTVKVELIDILDGKILDPNDLPYLLP